MSQDVYYDEGGAVYNVIAYGATGDGSTDDTAGLRAAKDAADPAASPPGPGGTVYFPGGIYPISSDLTVPAHVGFTFAPNALLATNGYKLIVEGTLRAGLHPILKDVAASPVPIEFGDGTVAEVHPEWFGAVADGITDCSPAIQAAVDSLPARGGIVRFSAGVYRIDSEIVVAKSGVQLVGGARQGKLWVGGTGSYLQLGPNVGQGAMVRFTKAPNPADPKKTFNAMGCGVSGLSFVNEGDERRWTCGAGLHVEASDAFTLDNCTFESLVGRALRVTRSVQSQFANVRVMRCGSAGCPAVHVDGNGDGEYVQGSTFAGFRVEGCFDEPYMRIEAAQHKGDNSDNKFDEIGFEGYERGENEPAWPDTAQTFLEVAGPRNQFGKLHFNRVADTAAGAKLIVTADHCAFGELLFSGVRGPGGSLEITGKANSVGTILVRSPWRGAKGIQSEIRILGDANRIGSITCGPHDDETRIQHTPAGIEIGGRANVVESLECFAQPCVTIAGEMNLLRSYHARQSTTTALRVTGQRIHVANALIEQCQVADGPVVEVSAPQVVERNWASWSRLRVHVVDAPFASEGVWVDSAEVRLLPGTTIERIPSGHGLRWTGKRGGWSGLTVDDVGRDGIRVGGGTPVEMHDWTVRGCSTRSGPGKPEFGGFRATAPAFEPEPASCTGFRIHEGDSLHQYSFKIESAGTGGGDHGPWQIHGNVTDGGPVDLPTGVQHAVDFDSQGQGDDVASASTITLPDTADFVTVTGTTDIQTVTASWKGRRVTLRFTSALDVQTGGNLLLNGTYTTSANATLTLICDGTYWYEVSRSVT